MGIFRGIPKWRPIVDILLSILWSVFNCNYLLTLTALTENVLHNAEALPKLILYYALYFVIWELAEFAADSLLELSMTAIENGVSSLYYNKIYHIKPSVLKKHNTGYISGALTRFISRQESAYRCIVQHLPLAVSQVAFFIYQTYRHHWSLGLALLVLCVFAVAFQLCGGRLVVKKGGELTGAESFRDKLVVDTVINIGTVQKMQSFDFLQSKMQKEIKNCEKKTRSFAITKEIFFCGLKLIIFLYVPICLLIYNFALKGTGFDATAFFALLSVMGVTLVHSVKQFSVVIEKVLEFLGAKSNLDNIVNDANNRNGLDTSVFEVAEIKDIDYTYQTTDDDQEEHTVHVNIPYFKLEKGDITCICGESGQGKTTLLHILSGELETDGVYINGVRSDKRLDCVFIAQDTEILDMSLRDNLVLGSENIPDALLLEYLEAVGLKEWFDKQKDGLDTLLGERGVFVSTGQRQRLNLIRGLLRRDKEIYLLDEPTSNVDGETEEKMINLIKTVLKDKTAVIVTHKPKIVGICNHAYEFENGTVSRIR